MDLQFHIYRSFDRELKAVWRQLSNECSHYVFQSYEWLSHWYHTVGQNSYGIEPVVVVVSDASRPLALFPFGIRKVGGVKVLEFMGGGQSDYNAPVISTSFFSSDQFRVLWHKVLDKLPKHDVRYFIRMPEQLGGIRNLFLDTFPSVCDGISYAASLPNSWEDFRLKLPSKFQKDNARMIRRLSEKGKLEFIVANSDSEFNMIIETMFVQKERRYIETGARNVLSDINTRNFYRKLGKVIANDAQIHMSALVVNDEILATHLGVVHQSRFYYLFPTFAGGAWSKFSPGRLLLEHLVQWAIAHRLQTYDFTIGAEAYKEIWCDSHMPLYRITEPQNIRGQFFCWVQAFIHWIKRNQHTRAFAMSVLRALNTFRRN